jgi:polysaccharide export outer membrane protein
MLHPVPATAPSSQPDPEIIASSWQPVQHVCSYPPAGADAAVPPVVRTTPAPGPVAVRGPIYDLPTPGGGTIIAGTGTAPAQIAGAAAEPTLPPPRVMPQPAFPGTGPLAPGEVVVNAPPHGSIPAGPEAIPPVPKEFQKQALPDYVVEPPDILYIQASEAVSDPLQPMQGQFLVRPDGKISLGVLGFLRVAGLTVEQIKVQVAQVLLARNPHRVKVDPLDPKKKEDLGTFTLEQILREVDVDVLAFNSKFYYVITDGGGYGAQVYRFPSTGNETVLDALSQVNGLPPVASKKCIWVARATPDGAPAKIMPVDWCALVKQGSASTNYQIYPNDRIYVESDPRIRLDTGLQKVLSPINRILGTTLLGASTVNAIRQGGGGGGGGGNGTSR